MVRNDRPAQHRGEALPLDLQNLLIHLVTISLCGAVLSPSRENSATELLDKADQALYVAKNNGRNRVEWQE